MSALKKSATLAAQSWCVYVARVLREMTPEQREAIRVWRRLLKEAPTPEARAMMRSALAQVGV